MTARARKKKPARKRAPKKKPATRSGNKTGPSTAARTGAVLASAGGAAARASAVVGAWCGRHVARFARWAVRSPDMQRACALGLLVGSLCLASYGVREEVESWPRFAVSAQALEEGDIPVGLSAEIRRDLSGLPLPHPTGSFDRRLVPFTAALLEDLEWIEEVHAVSLAPPADLQFSLRTRLPVAQLGSRILTADAAVMDRKYAAHPDVLPRVDGVPTGIHRDRALAAAVSVLDDLGDLAAQVEHVDVRGLDTSAGIVLTLLAGPKIEWGRPTVDERPHLPGESKRAALEEFLESGIDLGRVERVSLRWDETTYLLKPAEDLASARR